MTFTIAKPECYSKRGDEAASSGTFFATVRTFLRAPLFATERDASRLIDVLRRCVAEGCFELNDFVVMPDHVHLLITVRRSMTIERAVQLVKLGFTKRLRTDTGYQGGIWERGFSEKRANSGEDYWRFRGYIAQNPVNAGLCHRAEEFSHSFVYLLKKRRAE